MQIFAHRQEEVEVLQGEYLEYSFLNTYSYFYEIVKSAQNKALFRSNLQQRENGILGIFAAARKTHLSN